MYVWQGQPAARTERRSHERFAVVSGAAILAAIALATVTASLDVQLAAPSDAVVGETWEASLRVQRAGLPVRDARPLVAITGPSGYTRYFEATPGARAGSYRAKIVLPDGGRWTYEVRVGSRVYERGHVFAKPPPKGL